MKFGYKEYDRGIVRPVIPVELKVGDRSIRYEALVDSGADLCIFDAQLADIIGFDVRSGEPKTVAGITGEQETYYLHKITLSVGGHEFSTVAGFLPNIGRFGYGVLGQLGFFENFVVKFDFVKRTIEVSAREKK